MQITNFSFALYLLNFYIFNDQIFSFLNKKSTIRHLLWISPTIIPRGNTLFKIEYSDTVVVKQLEINQLPYSISLI